MQYTITYFKDIKLQGRQVRAHSCVYPAPRYSTQSPSLRLPLLEGSQAARPRAQTSLGCNFGHLTSRPLTPEHRVHSVINCVVSSLQFALPNV